MEAMSEKIKVLILEDNEIFYKIFKELSEKKSFEIVGFSKTAKDLLQKIKDKKPEVLILDLVIPKENVLELIQDIKKLYPKIPLIVYSSLKEDHIVSKVLEAGCFDYIFKPFPEDRLVESIKKAVA